MAKGFISRIDIYFVVILFALCGVLVMMLTGRVSEQEKGGMAADWKKDLANTFKNEELFGEAIDLYEAYLEEGGVDGETAAKVSFVVGNIWMDQLHDYEKAMAAYLRIRHFDPESGLAKEADKLIVECLERLGRSLDAQRHLEKATTLGGATREDAADVVAKIGNREVTMREIESEIERIPPYLKEAMGDQFNKSDFAQQYLAQELIYDSAKRKGLDKDKEINRIAFEAKKGAMVQRLLKEEVSDKVTIREEDRKLYYDAHKEEFVEESEEGESRQKGIEEVRREVETKLRSEREQSLYKELVERLMKAEEVAFYEDRIR